MTNKHPFYKITVILVLLTTFMLSACGGSDQNDTPAGNSADCLSMGKTMKEDERITAKLTRGDAYEETSNRTFTIEELPNYQFGMNGKETRDGYYATYELCNLDTEKYVHQAILEKEDSLWLINTTEEDFGTYGETWGGNLTAFYYENGSGEKVNQIENPGNYAVNVFSASKDGDWVWVASLEFKAE